MCALPRAPRSIWDYWIKTYEITLKLDLCLSLYFEIPVCLEFVLQTYYENDDQDCNESVEGQKLQMTNVCVSNWRNIDCNPYPCSTHYHVSGHVVMIDVFAGNTNCDGSPSKVWQFDSGECTDFGVENEHMFRSTFSRMVVEHYIFVQVTVL